MLSDFSLNRGFIWTVKTKNDIITGRFKWNFEKAIVDRYFIYLVLLVSAFSLTVSNAGVVCFGHDGHIALEPAHHSHCDHDGHAEDAEPQLSARHCSPCTDIALSTAPAEAAKVQKSAPAAAVVRAITGMQTTNHQNRSDNPGPIHESQYFSPLRTIILLT